MPRSTTRTGATLLAVACLACGGADEAGGGAGGQSGMDGNGEAADSIGAVQAGPADAPAEVYFDLTRHTWFKQGQPLVHASRSYEAEGEPVALAPETLRKVGRYQEVDYYARRDAAEPLYTLYVPVYYRYWQRFTAPPGRAAATADSAVAGPPATAAP